MKKVLILGAGPIQIPIIKKSKEIGLYTIVVDIDDKAKGAEFSDEFYTISTNDTNKILNLAKDKKINGILTTSDFPVNVVAEVGEKLDIPVMSKEVAQICTNKYLQREFLKNNHFNTPSYKVIRTLQDLEKIDFFPCIIKPVDSSASRGVRKVNNLKELYDQYSVSHKYSKSGLVIVEEFITGKEFSVETLTQDNKTHVIQITEKITKGEESGYFVEDTHIAPARIGDIHKKNIEEEVISLINKIGVNNCPTHTELKLNETGIYIIEIACRLGGDYITSDLVPLSTGIDMLQNLLLMSIGYKIQVKHKDHNEISCVQFLNPINYNKCVSFIEQGHECIVRSEVYNFNTNKIESSSDRLGYIILKAKQLSEIEKILEQIQ